MVSACSPPDAKPERLTSLDVFRGATIAAMILVNNPGDESRTFAPLLHAAWSGWTFTDTIFPSFLWIAGVAMTISFGHRLERGDSRRKIFLHVLKRSAILYLIGVFLGLAPEFHFATVRVLGVLQRIAICYLAASAIFLTAKLRGQILWCAALLGIYSVVMLLVPVPGVGAGSLTREANMERYIDGLLLTGHMWSHTRYWDPEGIVSTLPAICSMLFGIFTGHLLASGRSKQEKAAWLLSSGVVGLAIGAFLDNWFMPINKNLWTVSFAVFMAGISASGFGLCYWLIDVNGFKRGSKPAVVFGMNAIASYVLADFIAGPLDMIQLGHGNGVSTAHDAIFRLFQSIVPSAQWASFAFALTIAGAVYVAAWLLYRRKMFIRI